MTDIKWPDGATHKIDGTFMKWVDGVEYFYSKDYEWFERCYSLSLDKYKSNNNYVVIERPIDAPYMPQVGDWCEGYTTGATRNWRWLSVERLKDMGNGEFACLVDDKYLRFVDTFRPIKTDREQFIEQVMGKIRDGGHIPTILGQLYDNGARFK
tara:strand:- start:76 stop:537 length:462 start_codon:yes stop_codon:yes gene_type:complete